MGSFDHIEILGLIGVYFVPFLLALSVHEYAHGWMAKRKGDNTAELMGRLTLNPFSHADFIGTFLLPLGAIFMSVGMNVHLGIFGWAKPVPVNPRNLKHPKQDMFWVAFAGPLSNFIMAAFASLLFIVLVNNVQASPSSPQIAEFILSFIVINILLGLFNMIPIHPLDGGKILERFLPYKANRFLEDNTMTLYVILIAGFVMGAFRYLAMPGLYTKCWLTIHGFQLGWVDIPNYCRSLM